LFLLKKPDVLPLGDDALVECDVVVPERLIELLCRWCDEWCVDEAWEGATGEVERRREKREDFCEGVWVGAGAGGGEGSRLDPNKGILGRSVIGLNLVLYRSCSKRRRQRIC